MSIVACGAACRNVARRDQQILHGGRQPKQQGVAARVGRHDAQGQEPNGRLAKGLTERGVAGLGGGLPLGFQRVFQPVAFGGREPFGLVRPICEDKRDDEPQQHRRCPFDKEHPLPAQQIEPMLVHDQARCLAPQGQANRNADHQRGHGASPLGSGKPVREIYDHAREESGLGQAEQKPGEIKLPWRAYPSHAHRTKAPGEQDAGEPFPCAPMFDQQCAGNFQEQVTGEEDAEAPAENLVGEFQDFLHLQLGKPGVRPVQVGDDVRQTQERENSPGDFAAHGADRR